MKRISLAVIGTGLIGLTVAAFTLSPFVTADSPGQIGGGDIYRIKNLTQNVDFTDPASANACDELQYKVRLHNSGFSSATNIAAKASLPGTVSTTNTSTMDITYSGGVASNVSDTATLNISSAQSVSYENGTTQLLDGSNNLVKSLPDGITGNGVSIGDLNGSTVEFVQFKAKISCPQPQQPVYTCNDLELTAGENRTVKISAFSTTAQNGAVFKNAVVTWGDNASLTTANVVGQTHQYGADGTYTVAATAHFTVNGQDVTAGGPQCSKQITFKGNTPPTITPLSTPPATPAAPTSLVNTGPGSVAAIFAAVTVAGTFLYRRMLTRRLSRG